MRPDTARIFSSGFGAGTVLHRSHVDRIALIGNALPRLCGLATFTSHVHDALRERFPAVAVDHYAMVDPGRSYRFPPSVTRAIAQEDRASYRDAARAIEASRPDLVWVQHEFGIYGGPAGSYLFELVDRISAPLVVTLHTVLETPDPEQRRVIERLAARASLLIVMAERGREILERVYGIRGNEVAVIPHGVPDRAYVDPGVARSRFGLEDRPTILTFGLLSPGKGIETVIEALPAILRRRPDALYSIVGATHPHLIAHEGEAYRERLQTLAAGLGVDHALRWENRFLGEQELLDRIAAADVYVTPYANPAQITSGTLAYALGLGKPIVSTPYAHAAELLAQGRGTLVGFGDVPATADAIGTLLSNDVRRARGAAAAYAHGRSMIWARMAERSMAAFGEMLGERPATCGAMRWVSACPGDAAVTVRQMATAG
ncbi:glycosyltransferase family 4 protein [Sphingomonas sp. LB-2]|nr:glycosyltransferase family 4 protein [Sphingomonas caeni]